MSEPAGQPVIEWKTPGASTRQAPEAPCGIDHVVLYVRNLQASHVFWTECLGFKYVGSFRRGLPEHAQPTTRFYSAVLDGAPCHHTIALEERPGMAPMGGDACIDHLAIAYADEAAWRRQIAYLESRGVQLGRKVKRGTIGSTQLRDPDGYVVELVYPLPRDTWAQDIEAALNKLPEALP